MRAGRLVAILAATLVATGCTCGDATRDLSYDPTSVPMGVFDLHKPKTAPSGKPLPCVLLVHGGGWMSGDKRDMDDYADWLNCRGYAAVSMNYRLSTMKPWPAQSDDVLSAFNHLRAHAAELGIDSDRIAVSGISAGAHLSMMLALRGMGVRPKCAIALSGETDLDRPPAEVMDNYNDLMTKILGHGPPFAHGELQAMSPISYVRQDVAILLVHADGDTNIYVKQGDVMAAALLSAHANSTYLRLHSDCHGQCWKEIGDKIEAFLAANLR